MDSYDNYSDVSVVCFGREELAGRFSWVKVWQFFTLQFLGLALFIV